jgi:HD-GYP domain-containing protein (c-di-GMP phosphodiesterase class II)
MRPIDIEKVQSGQILGKSIFTADGRVLLREGTALTERYLKALREMQYGFIYVVDPRLPSIEVHDVIPEQLRQEAVLTIRRAFGDVAKGGVNLQAVSEVTSRIVESIMANDALIIQMADLKSHDTYTFSHSVNVCVVGTILGVQLGLDERKLKDLAMGLMLHDVGKMQISEEILHKPGRLTEEEYAKMQDHARSGFDLLRSIQSLSAHAKIVVLQHHEKYDGTGYPKGLKGNDIHLNGQIGAIADVYDALTSDRVYRKRFLPHEAIEYLMTQADRHFSLELVTTFISAVAPYPPGTQLKVSTGETGIVTEVDMRLASRPVLTLLQDAAGKDLAQPYPVLDLRTAPSLTITKVIANA